MRIPVALVSEPLLIELVWGLVSQSLARSHRLVDAIPGEQGSLQSAQIPNMVRKLPTP